MELATLHLDTYKVVKLLQEKGYTEAQAEGFIKAIQEITLSGVATKQDLQDVKDELKSEISSLRTDMLKILMVHTVTIIGVMVALFTFFSASS
ncbi:MAG: coiled-coil domain-containing protein [Bacteroidota bacterium]